MPSNHNILYLEIVLINIRYNILKQKLLKMKGHLSEKIVIPIYSQISKNTFLEVQIDFFFCLSCDTKSKVDFASTMELVSLFH